MAKRRANGKAGEILKRDAGLHSTPPTSYRFYIFFFAHSIWFFSSPRRKPGSTSSETLLKRWIPAFAGMTEKGQTSLKAPDYANTAALTGGLPPFTPPRGVQAETVQRRKLPAGPINCFSRSLFRHYGETPGERQGGGEGGAIGSKRPKPSPPWG